MLTSFVLFYLVSWIGLSIAIGVAASAVGRDGIGWFLIAAITSPLVAAILLLVLPRPTSESALRRQGRRACPFCAEPIRMEAKLCPHCRSEVPALERLTPWQQALERPGEVIVVLGFVGIVVGLTLPTRDRLVQSWSQLEQSAFEIMERLVARFDQ